jgi:hypothetical protein
MKMFRKLPSRNQSTEGKAGICHKLAYLISGVWNWETVGFLEILLPADSVLLR